MRIAALMFIVGTLYAADTPFWIAPCEDPKTVSKPGDKDLGRWALAAWENASGGRLHFIETKDRSKALIQIVWARFSGWFFGETVGIDVNERQGSRIMIYSAWGTRDALMHDTIVYLTCLHEFGHALGLEHSMHSTDSMFPQRNLSRRLFSEYAGDTAEYFSRCRHKVYAREDIRKNPGLSAADREQLMERLSAFEAR
jgi:hypothetical protein